MSHLQRVAPLALTGAITSGYMAIFPLLPDIQERHGISTSDIGVIAAIGFVATVAAELLLSPLADRGHARRLVAFGVVAMAVSLVGYAVASELWQLAALRGLAGVALGAFVPAISAEVIRSDPARAGESLGRIQAADLFGVALGPTLAAVIATFWSTEVTLLMLGIALLASLLLVRPATLVTPMVTFDDTRTQAREPVVHRTIAWDLLRLPGVVGAVLLSIAYMVPIGAYDSLWPRFMDDLGSPEWLVGLSYAVFAVPFMVLATTAGRYADKVGGIRAAWSGLAVMIPMIVLYAFVRNPFVITGIGFIESSGQAFMSTAAAAAMAHATPPERAAAGQGLSRSIGTVAAAAVAGGGAPIYSAGGAAALFGATAGVVLVVAVLATIAGASRPGGGPS